MILFKNDVFENAFIAHVVAVNKHVYSLVFAALFIAFYKVFSTFYAFTMALMTAVTCLSHYSTMTLICLNSKISHHVENSGSQLHAFNDLL